MKLKSTFALGLVISSMLASHTMNAQFFKYLPEESNYLRGDVKNEAGGLTFTYRLQDDSTLALKTLLMHTDNNGQVQWTREAGNNFGSYTIAPDTSVILTGGGTTDGNRYGILQKLDKTGAILWRKSLAISSADVVIGNIMIGAGNIIYATLTRSSFISSTYLSKSAVAAYDLNGNMLWTNQFGKSSKTSENHFARTILASNGDFIGVVDIRGASGASANGMMVTRISPDGTVRFAKYIDFVGTHTQLSVTGLVETASQEIIFGGRLMTDQSSKHTNTMWLGKLDSLGNMTQQKSYSGGEKVGENLHSLRYDNGQLYAYIHFYSPFDSILNQSIWMGIINEQTLSFTNQNATAINVNLEDPYGDVSNAFCISSDGKPTIAAGFYCTEKDKYFPIMQQWSSTLVSSCSALDVVQPIVDTATNYIAENYSPQNSFTVVYANDTNVIALTDVAPAITADLCNGCNAVTAIRTVKKASLFRIYPNPGNGLFYIDLEEGVQKGQVRISNILGATVFESTLKSIHQSIDLSTQSPGIYFVRLRTSDGSVADLKLIKDR
ncbi:MAG TPA: T9SS type A sorting domain-containing protein [Edaphocola sp.]|nr:T9SS type A sorting domain-containing protein [Edaphocola sp.]